jgi:ATP-dependent Lhr-like helicase
VEPDFSLAPDLSLDYVGSLPNAATVVDRLHPGTRRLVFVDSRRRVEELGDHLQRRGVDVYVSHSSLAAGERRVAERAFEEGGNCVINARGMFDIEGARTAVVDLAHRPLV